jgi:hypothetical protein
MELSQMSRVKSLITENSIDREILLRLEDGLLGQLVKHLRRDSRSVCAEQILASFINRPRILIAKRVLKAVLMCLLHSLAVGLVRDLFARSRVLEEEGVVHVSSRMTLRLEKSVEIPEGALDESISGHLVKTHAQQDFSKLRSDFHEGMQVTTTDITSSRFPVLLLK